MIWWITLEHNLKKNTLVFETVVCFRVVFVCLQQGLIVWSSGLALSSGDLSASASKCWGLNAIYLLNLERPGWVDFKDYLD